MSAAHASRLHLVIPMSGSGSRFLARGYTTPKPLIPVHGLPIIAHILERFPNVGRCTFICNQPHAQQTDLVAVLRSLRPDANIRVIPSHKLGPVFAVQQVYDLIRDDEPVVVNYCDFDWEWDFYQFLDQMHRHPWDGAVVGYTGFHPHLVGPDLYATMRVADSQVLEIREKHAFASDRLQEHTSSGTYYFATGAILKSALNAQSQGGTAIKGEHYVSSAFQHLIAAGNRIAWHPVTRFCQWGTPDDLQEYLRWSSIFEHRAKPPLQEARHIPNAVLLMAGHGARFATQGYTLPKPFIPVAGTTMVQQSLRFLPSIDHLVLACRASAAQHFSQTLGLLQHHAQRTSVLPLEHPTEGQACTARLALDSLRHEGPVLLLSCDSSLGFDHSRLQQLLEEGADAVVLASMPHQPALWHPKRYGWLETKGSSVTRVSTKLPVSDHPANDPLVTGSFCFRSPGVARLWIDRLVDLDLRTNGEFYLDDVAGLMARSGADVRMLLVDQYVSWGTPEELQTFQYWQAHFAQNRHHPYSLAPEPL